MAIININSDGVVKFTNKLEKIHRSAVPVSVRTALNTVAFDVKQNTLQKVSKKKFINRTQNFFKAFSGVEKATGFNINTMHSKAGMIKRGNSEAADNMVQQEIGGIIKSRSFIPIDSSRVGKSHEKRVKKINRLRSITKVAPRVKRGDKKNYIKTAHRVGIGRFIIYGNTLYRVANLKRGNIKLLPLYSYKKNRSVKVKGNNFVRTSALISARKLETAYINAAKKRIARL